MKTNTVITGIVAGLALFGATQVPQAVAGDTYSNSPHGGITIADPVRLLDTRDGGEARVKVAPRPVWASAAIVNVTVVDPAAPGFATVYDCGELPDVSNVNWDVGDAVASNLAAVKLSADGEVCVHTSSPAYVVVDLFGFAQTAQVDVLP